LLVADLKHLSLASGPDPQISEHYATKNYVDAFGKNLAVVTIGGSATPNLSAAGTVVRVNSSSASSITVPPNSSVAFPVGTRFWVRKVGTGNVSVVGGSGVTINWPGGNFTISTQFGTAEVHKIGTDTWDGTIF
jgi:uncharacterized protein (AIM24 family)